MSKLPTTYIKNYVLNLLKTYGPSCPVMSRFVNIGPSTDVTIEQLNTNKKCPFLKDESIRKLVKEVSKDIQEDIIEPKENTGYCLI